MKEKLTVSQMYLEWLDKNNLQPSVLNLQKFYMDVYYVSEKYAKKYFSKQIYPRGKLL